MYVRKASHSTHVVKTHTQNEILTRAQRSMSSRTIIILSYISNSVEYNGTLAECATAQWSLSIEPCRSCYILSVCQTQRPVTTRSEEGSDFS